MGSAVLAGSLPVPEMSDGEGPRGSETLPVVGRPRGARLRAQGRQGAKSHPWGPCQMLDWLLRLPPFFFKH